jgi:hypothetical protein
VPSRRRLSSQARVIHRRELPRMLRSSPIDAVDLGREDDVVAAAAGERLGDDLLGLAARVDVGGVDEVDPRVERAVDDPDRLVVVGVAPGAEHHRAEAQRADLHAGTAERAVLHVLEPTRLPQGGPRAARRPRAIVASSSVA